MSNSSKRKGDRYELDLAAWLQANGFPYADRALGAGRKLDRGDIVGTPATIEAKNHKRLLVPEWVVELESEAELAGTEHAVIVAKRRGTTNIGSHYAITTVGDYFRLLHEADGVPNAATFD